jgi:hypothetical protein
MMPMDDTQKILKSRAIFTDFGGTSPVPVHNLCAYTSSNEDCAYESSYVNSRGLEVVKKKCSPSKPSSRMHLAIAMLAVRILPASEPCQLTQKLNFKDLAVWLIQKTLYIIKRCQAFLIPMLQEYKIET